MSACGCGCKGKADVSTEDLKATSSPPVKPLGTELGWRDRIGGWRVRWNIRRMDYAVAPGLYSVGAPDPDSPVLVTANYKLTVDSVRRHLTGLSVWLLVLDTKGVNVWCAAGKGTFGTEELVRRIAAVGLAERVKHRNLIVPQLGATGVAAHEVKRATGFSVRYGPVRADDIPAYLAAGMRATPEMRRVRFSWTDRLALTPTELMGALKPLALLLAALLILTFVRDRRLTAHFIADVIPFVAAALTGGVLVPLLLPWLPFRYFALKGAVAGLAISAISRMILPSGIMETASTALIVIAATSYMAMMFTGSTTFTTLAGAQLEVRRALPLIIGSAVIGAVVRAAAVFV